jgi:hypothetical protein
MTITRLSSAHRHSQPPKYAWNVRLNCALNAARERRKRQLRNVCGDRDVAAMTRGTASANAGSEAGSGTCPTREKIGGSRQRGGGTMRRESVAVPGPRGGLGETRKVRPGAADTVLTPLLEKRRGRNAIGGGGGARRGVGALMELTREGLSLKAVLKHLPSGIAHILPRISTMKVAFHGRTDAGGVLEVLA